MIGTTSRKLWPQPCPEATTCRKLCRSSRVPIKSSADQVGCRSSHTATGLHPAGEIGNTGVVKYAAAFAEYAGAPDRDPADGRTRDRVAQLLLEQGSATTSELSEALGLSCAAIRRHLDAMLADGLVEARERPVRGRRGRGRPAKTFTLTATARESFPHTYDDLATNALRCI